MSRKPLPGNLTRKDVGWRWRNWRPLPKSARARCGRAQSTFLGQPIVTYRIGVRPTGCCGKSAVWIHKSTCGCGKCDMTLRLCQEHKDEYEVRNL